MDNIVRPGYRTSYGVNPSIAASNVEGEADVLLTVPTSNPEVFHPVVQIEWQNGASADKPRNGAFVEDVIWAALQRLEYFNSGEFRDRRNSIAITHLEEALWALQDRTNDRVARGVEGKEIV